MKIKTLASCLVAVFAAAMLLTVTPSCGCEEPWREFLMVFGVDNPSRLSSLDADIMSAAAHRHLIGKPLKDIEFPQLLHGTTCAEKSAARLDCEFWFMKGPVLETGFHVVLQANPQGTIHSAEVANMHRVLGRWTL